MRLLSLNHSPDLPGPQKSCGVSEVLDFSTVLLSSPQDQSRYWASPLHPPRARSLSVRAGSGLERKLLFLARLGFLWAKRTSWQPLLRCVMLSAYPCPTP